MHAFRRVAVEGGASTKRTVFVSGSTEHFCDDALGLTTRTAQSLQVPP